MSKHAPDEDVVISVDKTEDEWTWRMTHRTGYSETSTAPTEDEARDAAQRAADNITSQPHGPA
jgi:hypothetical protein